MSYKFGEEGQAPLVVAADLPHLKDAPAVVLPQGSPWRGFYAGVNAGGVIDASKEATEGGNAALELLKKGKEKKGGEEKEGKKKAEVEGEERR